MKHRVNVVCSVHVGCMYSCVVIDAWTLMVLVYLFMTCNQEPGLNTRQVITLINGIKLCKETLVKGKYRIFQGSRSCSLYYSFFLRFKLSITQHRIENYHDRTTGGGELNLYT